MLYKHITNTENPDGITLNKTPTNPVKTQHYKDHNHSGKTPSRNLSLMVLTELSQSSFKANHSRISTTPTHQLIPLFNFTHNPIVNFTF